MDYTERYEELAKAARAELENCKDDPKKRDVALALQNTLRQCEEMMKARSASK